MALYTRAQYDADMEALDAADQMISRGVAIPRGEEGHIDGFRALALGRSIERQREMLKGKLFGTVMRLKDRDAGGCSNPAHGPKCKCMNLRKAQLAEQGA